MTYTMKIETFGGSVKTIALPSKGAVAQFVSTYPNQLPLVLALKSIFTAARYSWRY